MTLEEAIQDLAKSIREATDRKDKRLERMKQVLEEVFEKMKRE